MAVVMVLGICIVLVTCSHVFFAGAQQLAAENGPLENLQQLLLALAGIAFAVHVFTRTSRQPRERSLILVALFVTFLLRETDVAVPGKIPWLSYWIDESGKKILLAAAWLAVIFYVAGRGPLSFLVRANAKTDATFWILALAAGMLFVSWAFDRKYLLSSRSLQIEEVSEVIGYALMLIAGIQFTQAKKQLPVVET
jgi:hypothetical protein